ncbi:MAG: hypothetical protein P9L94_20225 [Candidatus Hinthialibacter antarcticus]|nr:hypothetical protein [Candidatus Hinthialibacter antarcticus]
MRAEDDAVLVYSTESGPSRQNKNKRDKNSTSGKQKPAHPNDGVVRVARETKGRKGKGVTLVTGLRHCPDELKKIAKQLKQMCGSGGAVKDGVIEIQGDHRDKIAEELTRQGHTVKKVGG